MGALLGLLDWLFRHRHDFVLQSWCWRTVNPGDGPWNWRECRCGRVAPFPGLW